MPSTRKKLRTWISDKNTSPERLGLYGMMLGLCGDDADALFLRGQIGQPVNDDIRFGIDGLMGGLLLLTQEDGLKFLQQSRLKNTSASTLEAMAAMNAVKFIWAYEPDMFAKEQLRASLHPLLQREDLRELAITDLARWEDWNAVSLLSDVYSDCGAEDSRTTTAVVRFLLTLQKLMKDEPDSRYVAAATELLTEIRRENPRLVRSAERFFD